MQADSLPTELSGKPTERPHVKVIASSPVPSRPRSYWTDGWGDGWMDGRGREYMGGWVGVEMDGRIE